VRSFDDDFHEEPWVELPGWGRGVRVRSAVDLDVVRRFINAEGAFRRAVVFENLTAPRRRELTAAIEGLGVELREFTDADKATVSVRTIELKDKLFLWCAIALASPLLVARRLTARTTEVYEISRSASPSTNGA
jgi:hypothetical protein